MEEARAARDRVTRRRRSDRRHHRRNRQGRDAHQQSTHPNPFSHGVVRRRRLLTSECVWRRERRTFTLAIKAMRVPDVCLSRGREEGLAARKAGSETPRDVRTITPSPHAHAFAVVYDGDFPTGDIRITAHLAGGRRYRTAPLSGNSP
jgi:hypothetical protein